MVVSFANSVRSSRQGSFERKAAENVPSTGFGPARQGPTDVLPQDLSLILARKGRVCRVTRNRRGT
ncbi:hypothetical protein X772_17765 [Mesorhizobium sp. LSJC280B00]|nr:hypothetical protein X772_17765 [Mesorhizobium sp. LSJC280B00]